MRVMKTHPCNIIQREERSDTHGLGWTWPSTAEAAEKIDGGGIAGVALVELSGFDACGADRRDGELGREVA